jgi:hypothetical protein
MADFESTLMKDSASLSKIPQDCARLRHLARKTHRCRRKLTLKKKVLFINSGESIRIESTRRFLLQQF